MPELSLTRLLQCCVLCAVRSALGGEPTSRAQQLPSPCTQPAAPSDAVTTTLPGSHVTPAGQIRGVARAADTSCSAQALRHQLCTELADRYGADGHGIAASARRHRCTSLTLGPAASPHPGAASWGRARHVGPMEGAWMKCPCAELVHRPCIDDGPGLGVPARFAWLPQRSRHGRAGAMHRHGTWSIKPCACLRIGDPAVMTVWQNGWIQAAPALACRC